MNVIRYFLSGLQARKKTFYTEIIFKQILIV